MYDSQWACISRWLTGSLSPSSRRTTEAFYPHTYPPADSLFMLCGRISAQEVTATALKRDKWRRVAWPPTVPAHIWSQPRLISAPWSANCTQPTPLAPRFVFFPSPDQYINLSHPQTPPLFGFRSKSLSACFPQSLLFPCSLSLTLSLYHFLCGFEPFTHGVVIVSALSTPHPLFSLETKRKNWPSHRICLLQHAHQSVFKPFYVCSSPTFFSHPSSRLSLFLFCLIPLPPPLPTFLPSCLLISVIMFSRALLLLFSFPPIRRSSIPTSSCSPPPIYVPSPILHLHGPPIISFEQVLINDIQADE